MLAKEFITFKLSMENKTDQFDFILSTSNECPQQSNRNDCGVFLMSYARAFMKENSINQQSFKQTDICSIRKLIKYELLYNKILK